MNTDFIAGISDASTDSINLLFTQPEGQKFLKEKKGLTDGDIYNLEQMGYSAMANMLAGEPRLILPRKSGHPQATSLVECFSNATGVA